MLLWVQCTVCGDNVQIYISSLDLLSEYSTVYLPILLVSNKNLMCAQIPFPSPRLLRCNLIFLRWWQPCILPANEAKNTESFLTLPISSLSWSLFSPLTSTHLPPLLLFTHWSNQSSSLTWVMPIALQPIYQPPLWLLTFGIQQNVSQFMLLCIRKLCRASAFHSE